MNQILNQIVSTIFKVKGNDELPLSDPITIRISDLLSPLEIHGLRVTTKNELTIMTKDTIGGHLEFFWSKIEASGSNAYKIIPAIYDRIMKDFNQRRRIA